MNKLNKKSKGFTLIELMVVIAIISLLSMIVLASLATARAKARDAERLEDIHNIRTALELYFSDHGYYPHYTSSYNVFSSGFVTAARTWSNLQTFLNGYITLPVDPINLGVNGGKDAVPFSRLMNHGADYSYTYITDTTGSTYDLMTEFEVIEPQGCAYQTFTSHEVMAYSGKNFYLTPGANVCSDPTQDFGVPFDSYYYQDRP